MSLWTPSVSVGLKCKGKKTEREGKTVKKEPLLKWSVVDVKR